MSGPRFQLKHNSLIFKRTEDIDFIEHLVRTEYRGVYFLYGVYTPDFSIRLAVQVEPILLNLEDKYSKIKITERDAEIHDKHGNELFEYRLASDGQGLSQATLHILQFYGYTWIGHALTRQMFQRNSDIWE